MRLYATRPRLSRQSISMSKIRLTSDLLGLEFFLVGFLSVHRRILSLARTPVDLGPRGTINDDLNGMESARFSVPFVQLVRRGVPSGQFIEREKRRIRP